MQRSHMEELTWREAYRMSEVGRLETQQIDPSHNLDVEYVLTLAEQAIDRRWGERATRTAKRMKALLRLRFLEENSLVQCGVVLDVSRERVRQMETQLLRVVREHLERQGGLR